MTETLRTLKQKRVRMMLLNLAYFLALLSLGTLIFLKGMGGVAYLAVATCVTVYLLAVRPVSRRYTAAVRKAILQYGVCADLTDICYEPKGGVTAEQVHSSGLMPASTRRSFVSREHITGCSGTLSVELADVTYPIIENGLNTMFSGAFVQLNWPGAAFAPMTVEAGALDALKLPKAQLELLREMGSMIPGNLYLRAKGDSLFVLLRGRFLGFRVNPLMAIQEKTLESNMFPELKQAVQLARLMRLHQA